MPAHYQDPVIFEDAADPVDIVTVIRRAAALFKTGASRKTILDCAKFSSIATDERGVIHLFNVGGKRMLGYTAIEVVDKSTPADISLKEGHQPGASACVVKPVRFQDFADAVKTIGKFWGVLNVLRPGGFEPMRAIESRD